MDKYAILIPTYNEEYNVVKQSAELEKLEIPYLFIDDGSTDKTLTHLWMKDLPHFGYFPNRGKGHALKFGARYLIKEGYDWILTMDADGQTDIEDIEKFDNALLFGEEKYDIFIGNRMWDKKSMPFIRRLINRFMSWIISILAGQKIEDSQCGFRMIHKDIFEQLDLKEDGFALESEMLIKAGKAKMKIKSIPIRCVYFKGRKSKIRPFRDMFRFIRMLWRLKINK